MDSTSQIKPLQKNKRKHIFVVVGLLAASIGLVYFLARGLEKSSQIPSALLGKRATNIKALWIQGQEHAPNKGSHFNLDDFKGRPIILNFWASWCFSCRHEARDLEQVWLDLKDQGVMVVGIAIQDAVEDAQRFAKQYGKTYILGLDEDGRASIDYGVTGVPESFFINRQGMIVHKEAAPLSREKLLEFSQKIL